MTGPASDRDAVPSDAGTQYPPWQVGQALVKAALDGVGDADLVVVLAEALTGAGFDLLAIEVACDVLNVEAANRCIRWRRGHAQTDGALHATDVFRGMLRDDVMERRLTTGSDDVTGLETAGATDAVAFAGHLAPDVTLGFFDDVMTLFATDRSGGFAGAEVDLLRQVVPVFALAIGARLNAAAARMLLRTYLGRDAATALLGGRLSLGDVATVKAVVLYCDLLGFTSMTERLDGRTLIGRLNHFFETVTRPASRAGGQVSGHVGDAVIIFFPVPGAEAERAVCAAAVQAAVEGLRDLSSLIEGAPGAEAPLRARIGIDMGDVVHGNVGSPGRFSFTIIGTPVNRAARLQALARELGAAVLMTAEVACAAGVPCRAFGRRSLKGFDQPVDVMGLGSTA